MPTTHTCTPPHRSLRAFCTLLECLAGALCMCPPHQFSQFAASGHLCRPAWTRFFAYLALHGLHSTLHALPHTSAHLCAPLCTSMHLCAPLCTPAQLLHFTFQG